MLMCNICLDVFSGTFHTSVRFQDIVRCPKRSCHGKVINVDESISLTIMQLIKKGYKTNSCCSGHWYDNEQHIYIAFTNSAYVPPLLPDGFVIDESLPIMIYNDKLKGLDKEMLHIKISQINVQLVQWAYNLPLQTNMLD
jgi:hypothetical protein